MKYEDNFRPELSVSIIIRIPIPTATAVRPAEAP
jgi:hypothetical protein